MGLRLAILTLLGCLGFAGSARPAALDRFFNNLGPALVAGGFSGSTDCQHDKLSVRHVGAVQKFGRAFEVYDYQYGLQPACPHCALHGGQRLIFMNRGRYLGQYKPDFVRVVIRHDDLLLVPTDSVYGSPVKVRFTRNGPPKRLLVGGEAISFFR